MRLIARRGLARHVPLRVLLLDSELTSPLLAVARTGGVSDDFLHGADTCVSVMHQFIGGSLVFGDEGSTLPIKVDQRNCLRACGVSNTLQKTRPSERRQSIAREEYASTA